MSELFLKGGFQDGMEQRLDADDILPYLVLNAWNNSTGQPFSPQNQGAQNGPF
jgi:hypothetical protein